MKIRLSTKIFIVAVALFIIATIVMAYSQSINLLTTKLKIKLYQTNTCDGNIGYRMNFLLFTGYIIIVTTYRFVS